MSTEFVVLKSSDGQTFRIEKAAARQSEVIAHMIEDCDNQESANQEIPLSNVTSKILAIVVEYCKKHHADDANPSADEDLKNWDKQFMQIDQSTLFDLFHAANYLSIKNLLDLTFQAAVDMIKDKTPEEIRLMNDYTRAADEAVRKEYQRAFK